MSDTCELEVNIRNVAAKENPALSGEYGRYIEISSTDHGVGISDEYLAKVFDPYFTKKSKGDGLGLCIAQAIVKNHGGETAIESVPGVETTVHVYIPVDKHAEIDQPQQSAETSAPDGKLLSGKRVLVMDDEEFIRKVAGNILEHLGCEVDFAEEGTEAIKKYEDSLKSENRFDFVILDLTVHEGMSGQDALEKLKAIDPDVKAFLSSGYTHDAAMLNFGQSGFVGVINKPYEIEDFIKSFCDVMSA